MSAWQLLPAIRGLYSRHPEFFHHEPWELVHVLYSLNYTDDLADEERHEHLAAYYRLDADRYALEEEAEAQLAALLNTLEELKRIDVRQRQQSTRAGRPNAHGEHPIRFLLADWLGARLGGVEGYLDSSISPTFAERSLPELDGLAAKPAPHAGVDEEE
jgi:hypothetical protein